MLLAFLLPDSINSTGLSFSENDKNKLIREAKEEVKELSLNLIRNLESKIHKSARDTLEAIAKGFGAKKVEFELGQYSKARYKLAFFFSYLSDTFST